jgi:hypothetical protein
VDTFATIACMVLVNKIGTSWCLFKSCKFLFGFMSSVDKTPMLFTDRDTTDWGKRGPTGLVIPIFFRREESFFFHLEDPKTYRIGSSKLKQSKRCWSVCNLLGGLLYNPLGGLQPFDHWTMPWHIWFPFLVSSCPSSKSWEYCLLQEVFPGFQREFVFIVIISGKASAKENIYKWMSV